MADELDPRIVRVGIEIDGQIKYYEDLAISATGTKYSNQNQNECQVKIANLDKATRNYILTETSPFNKNATPKKLIVEAGRVSYGTTKIFVGDIVTSGTPKNPNSVPNKDAKNKSETSDSNSGGQVSQPPDIVLTLNALTSNYDKGNIIATNQPAQAKFSTVCESVAASIGCSLDFQTLNNLNISNYSYSGAALGQVNKLQQMGNFNVYVDDNVLVVKDAGVPLSGRTRILNLDSGMIGIPELNEKGIKVKFLLDNETTLGSALEITSVIYPTVNGTYVIDQLGFDIANRDTNFYWIACATRIS